MKNQVCMGDEQSFQQMILRQLDSPMPKNEVVPLFHTTYKNLLKWTDDLNVISKAIKLLEENIVINHDQIWQWFLRYETRAQAIKEKNN